MAQMGLVLVWLNVSILWAASREGADPLWPAKAKSSIRRRLLKSLEAVSHAVHETYQICGN